MTIAISAAWLAPILPVLACVYLAGWRSGFNNCKTMTQPALDKAGELYETVKAAREARL